jgi:hypothetical protein
MVRRFAPLRPEVYGLSHLPGDDSAPRDAEHSCVTTSQVATQPPPWLVDEFVDSWVRWREACEDVRRTYDWWGACASAQRPAAFASYRAALDREEDAAWMHSLWTEQIRRAIGR